METKNHAPAVLLYRIPEFSMQGMAVRSYLSAHGIRIVAVGPEAGGKTLATLLGLQQEPPGVPVPLPNETAAVMYGLMGPVFEDLLELFHETGGVSLKAVATPHNLHWTFGYLLQQLQKERRQLGG